MANTLRLRLVQFAPGVAVDANLERIREMVEGVDDAAPAALSLVVLPECCLCFAGHERIRAAARPAAAWVEKLAPLAGGLRTAMVFGGVPVAEQGRVFNSSLAFGADGRLLARYDKIHLFQLDTGAPSGIDESVLYAPGAQPANFELEGWRIGLSICYDLRFPELFREYAPADLLLCTAAFAAETGGAHWEILLRARAIENQCYVAGAGLCGSNPETGFECYGHALVAGPWGERVRETGDGEESVLTVDLSREHIAEVRRRLPALRHRRPVGLPFI